MKKYTYIAKRDRQGNVINMVYHVTSDAPNLTGSVVECRTMKQLRHFIKRQANLLDGLHVLK